MGGRPSGLCGRGFSTIILFHFLWTFMRPQSGAKLIGDFESPMTVLTVGLLIVAVLDLHKTDAGSRLLPD